MTSWDGSGPPWEPQEEPAAPGFQQYAQNDGVQPQRGAYSGGYQDQAAPGDGYGPRPGEAGFQLGRRPAGYRPGGFTPAGFGSEDGQPGAEQNGHNSLGHNGLDHNGHGFGQNGHPGYGQAALGQSGYPSGDLERPGLGQAGYGQPGYGVGGYDPSGYGAAGQDPSGQNPSGYGAAAYGQDAYGQQGLAAPGYPGTDYPGTDYTGNGSAGNGYAGNDFPGTGYAGNGFGQNTGYAGNGYGQDTGYAGNGYAGNGYGQGNGYAGYGQDAYSPGFAQGTGQYATQQYGAGQLESGPYDPSQYDPSQYGGQGRFGASQDGGWGNGPEVRITSLASAPVKRSGKALAAVVFGLLCAAGISAGAVQITHSTLGASSSTGNASTTTTTQSSPQATPSAKSSTGGGSYQLSAPATAGGYKADKQVPAAQIGIAQTVAGTIKMQVEQTGVGNVTSTVSGSYLINSNLLAIYTGFNGTFSAELIAKAFSTEAANGSTVNPGPHGGIMGCGVVSGGTICVWVTGKTLAVVEYFNATGRVTMANTTAATYALNIRDSVEVPAR